MTCRHLVGFATLFKDKFTPTLYKEGGVPGTCACESSGAGAKGERTARKGAQEPPFLYMSPMLAITSRRNPPVNLSKLGQKFISGKLVVRRPASSLSKGFVEPQIMGLKE